MPEEEDEEDGTAVFLGGPVNLVEVEEEEEEEGWPGR